MYELALFAGAGGGILGGKLCGFTCIGAVEIEEYPREVLKQRQRDGHLPEFPIWDDVTTFRADNPECTEYIQLLREQKEQLVISGGFPCQDISTAGKGAGITKDSRSGLWAEYARIISEIRPRFALLENSPMLTSRGLGIVLADLAEMGYNARWGVLGAVDVGACIQRERIWILASSGTTKKRWIRTAEKMQSEALKEKQIWSKSEFNALLDADEKEFKVESEDDRMGDGIPYFMERFGAIGNAQVPAVVKAAWEILK